MQTTPARVGASVAVLVWEHKRGTYLSVHTTREGAVHEKAEIARAHWVDTELLGLPPQPPDDDEEAARLYFDAVSDDECAWIHESDVQP